MSSCRRYCTDLETAANPETCRGDVVVQSTSLGASVAKNAFFVDFDPIPDCACNPLPAGVCLRACCARSLCCLGYVAIRVKLYMALLVPFGFRESFRSELALLLKVFPYRQSKVCGGRDVCVAGS